MSAPVAPSPPPADATAPESAGRVRRWLLGITGGGAIYPLVILAGLYMVNEFDQTAFGIVLPDIQKSFHLDLQAVLTVVAISAVAALVLQLPIAYYADRMPRTTLIVIGATLWMCFSGLTGLATTVAVLCIARAGAGLGTGIIGPTHTSLIADYYDIPVRTKVYAGHAAGRVVGDCLGPLLAGLFAYWLGWRAPFLIFMIPTAVFIVLALRLKEPLRGHFERKAAAADADAITTEEVPPSHAESWRIVWQVRTLRRIFYSLPFLSVAIVGLLSFTSLYYSQVFHLDPRARGLIAAAAEPGQIIGLLVGIPLATRLMNRDPGLVLKFLAVVAALAAGAWAIFAVTPRLGLAIAMNVVLSSIVGLIAPGVFAALSLAVPPKVRSFGYAVAALWILPGLVLLPIVGGVADNYGIRVGLILLVPVFLVGAGVLASAGNWVKHDIEQVWASTAAQSEVLLARRRGEVKLLLLRRVNVHYDNVQVLFGVDFEVDEGEIVALLGTNGAGKSTLLKTISGLVEASGGAIVFDGRDSTHTPPNEIAARGITMVPGGQGVFAGCTVLENLHLGGWLQRRERPQLEAAVERVLEVFPVLRARLHEPAGNLSGGQQQMLTLGMAFVAKPRLLMIDELSLGLAPTVVAQLLEIVRALRDAGTTIILVEQSVNVALTVAETAYFMEKGEIRFHGPTRELLSRPDVLRSVFLEGAATRERAAGNGAAEDAVPAAPAAAGPVPSAAAPGTNGERAGEEPAGVRLAVRGVTKRFGGVNALTDVGFEVGPGEIVGFIGPNGAGKTTLFDVISGFLPPDGGSVALTHEGQVFDVTRASAQRRARLGLGRSFQDGRLFPALTVEETIAVALEMQVDVRDPVAAALHLPAVVDSEDRVRERVDALVELMGLRAFRDKFVRELSTGSRRVVDLACVLAHEPTVLLLDEPSSGIAQREAEALGPLLVRIRDQLGASLLVVEHDLPLLTGIADRMIALDLGAVIAQGAPDDVVHHPAVIASYLGTSEDAIARSGSREPA